MSLIKSGAKAITEQVLKGGLGFTLDVLVGKDVTQAAVHCAVAASQHSCDRLLTKNAKLQCNYKRNGTSGLVTYLVRMASLIHPSSLEFVTSQLDLFSVPSAQTSLEDVFLPNIDPCSC